MKVLLVGNGGREHALAWKLSQSKRVSKIYVAPGNGGTQLIDKAENLNIGSSSKDFKKLAEFAQSESINLVVVGPEQPLVEGIEKYFRAIGIPVFGPSVKAAQMEGSKTFSKDFMARHDIPTARFGNFTTYEDAMSYLDSIHHNVVIKASGLAAGKGVLMPETKKEAGEALRQIMQERAFGTAGDEVVIEECLEGDELSILTFSDGYTAMDLPPAQDHKRIGDKDSGLNTGGMGAYAPAPIATPQLLEEIRETILKPTIAGMRKDGLPMVGCLFTGIMLTKTGPKVLEYNVRFGDPETQTVLPLLESDLFEVMLACAEHRLDSVDFKVSSDYAATVVMSAAGYPEAYNKGDGISISPKVPENTYIFHAGTELKDGNKLVTSGGRVIASSAKAATLREAVDRAYAGVECVQFAGKYNRTDIAYRAFRDMDNDNEPVGITYEQAGVSVDTGNQFVERIKNSVKSTKRVGADAEIGGFGGIFDLKACGFNDPLLVGATDGVGTKLMIAQAMNMHKTVGIDLVGMNVNDLIVQGAEPLFFLDYYASGKLDLSTASDFIEGLSQGCIKAGCALIGGETAEMPGLYHGSDYDVNGTCIGAVERNCMLPANVEEGDIVLGLASDGIHSNGFSLIRKIVEVNDLTYPSQAPWDPAQTVGSSLLTPTRIYVKPLLPVIRSGLVKAMAHITGGGLVENVPRILPKGLNAVIDVTKWNLPRVFEWMGKNGRVPVDDMAKTLNMGIGMVVVVKENDMKEVTQQLEKNGETVFSIGKIVKGEQKCELVNTENWY